MRAQQAVRRAPTGHRCGESHPRARMSDEDVELAHQLYDPANGFGYGSVAKVFDNYDPPITKDYIRNVIKLGRRA